MPLDKSTLEDPTTAVAELTVWAKQSAASLVAVGLAAAAYTLVQGSMSEVILGLVCLLLAWVVIDAVLIPVSFSWIRSKKAQKLGYERFNKLHGRIYK